MENKITQLIQYINSLSPFECDDLELLKKAIQHVYSDSWRFKLDDIMRYMDSYNNIIKPSYQGSWNCPIKWIRDMYGDEEHTYYKVLRKTNSVNKESLYQYEFHNSSVPLNKWIQAEISSSTSLSGLKKQEEGGTGGRFHLLLDYLQAQVYLSKRTNDDWFPKEIATIVPVRARKFQSLDLIYVPPTTFVWGIDSDEMIVPYEHTK